MRKALPLMLSLALTAGLAAACSNSNNTGGADKSGQPSNAPSASSSSPQPEKKITYNIFRNFNSPEYPEDGGPAKKIVLDALAKAGLTGIDYKVTLASGPDYATKLNLFAASGNLPDYFSIDVQTMARFADQGLILPLDDLLKNAPNVMKVIKQGDLDNLKYNGKIYALPVGYRPEPFNGPNTEGLVIRKDWLDNLGLKEPTTIAELHDVLKAFVTQDPDKNGKNDTVGLSASKTAFFNFVFGSFGVIPAAGNGAGGQALYWSERDGQLKPNVVLPETKQALALLQSWYKEGLIDPEFLVNESKQVQEKVISSKTGVYEGSAFDGDPKQPVFSSLLKATPTAKLN
ncbi:hypothetical protein SD70_24190 [Gordoniibacillus kamchatkensis]|uniref:Extracellular solute-binding protein n=1 Tax=Gordoniibacillus kamchatkensis TaxID=1590651 RepID=A0ABR5ACM0_9BACL|nr:extracellular solute-binding protein [Paenibacillus sp. VKM B-2647]KIL38789.1 hypothetical protein SD70_24190 [Paenibacillus sp. VKM B-2647]